MTGYQHGTHLRHGISFGCDVRPTHGSPWMTCRCVSTGLEGSDLDVSQFTEVSSELHVIESDPFGRKKRPKRPSDSEERNKDAANGAPGLTRNRDATDRNDIGPCSSSPQSTVASRRRADTRSGWRKPCCPIPLGEQGMGGSPISGPIDRSDLQVRKR